MFEAEYRLPDYVKGVASWLGLPVPLSLSCEEGTWDQAAEHALDFMARDRFWTAEFEDRIFERLFETWTDGWRGDDQPNLTKAEWFSRMVPDWLQMMPSGYFEIGYKDGDLFWGHSIVVWGSLEKGVLNVSLFG